MTRVVLTLALSLVVAAAAAAQSPSCAPTKPDMLGPFYKPDAPERAVTGHGLVVNGTVRSTRGCAALPGARLEWWSADGRGDYQDELRATQRTGGEGAFRYETVAPGRYPGRPPPGREPRFEMHAEHLETALGAIRLGIRPADQVAVVYDRQRVVAVQPLRARRVHLDAIVEAEQAGHALAIPEQRVERRQ